MTACVIKAAHQRNVRVQTPQGDALSAGKRHALHVKERLCGIVERNEGQQQATLLREAAHAQSQRLLFVEVAICGSATVRRVHRRGSVLFKETRLR